MCGPHKPTLDEIGPIPGAPRPARTIDVPTEGEKKAAAADRAKTAAQGSRNESFGLAMRLEKAVLPGVVRAPSAEHRP